MEIVSNFPHSVNPTAHSKRQTALTLNAALAHLAAIPNWLAFLNVYEPGKRKPRKRPHNPHGDPRHPRQASVTEPRTWGTYDQANAFARAAQMDGVGIVLTRNLGLTLIDLDDCIDSAGSLEPWAAALVAQFDSYTEYSPSGRGLHILVWGAVTALKTKRVEIYSTERYTTITGRPYGPVRPIRQAQGELEALRAKYAPPPPVERKPAALPSVDASNAAVIEILCRNPKQAARWAGNVTGNRSSHLYGLINGLIWLCGDDPARIERLVRQSGLYDPKRHEQNSGGGRSNLAVSIFNAIATWTGTPYKWPAQTTSIAVTDLPPTTTSPPTAKPQPETHPLSTEELIAGLRILQAWLSCGGLATQIHGKTYDNDLAVLTTVIEIAIERGRLDDLAIGLEEIRRRGNIGSTSTVRLALERHKWLVTKETPGDKVTKADRYAINQQPLLWALELTRTPDTLTRAKSHDEKTFSEKIMRFSASEQIYVTHLADDTFSTGGGGLGAIFHNEQPAARKLLLLLIQMLIAEALPMTALQLAEVTGRPLRSVGIALTRGYRLGLFDRQQENGTKKGRRYWYTVAGDWESKAAAATLDMRSFGVGLDRAGRAAEGLAAHAEHLLDPDRIFGPTLDDAQRATLKAWLEIASIEGKGLDQIAYAAASLTRERTIAVIAGAKTTDSHRRALMAAREFSKTILADVEDISLTQLTRLFQHWCALVGYYDLTRRDKRTHHLITIALRTVRLKQPAILPPPPVETPAIAAPPASWQRPLLAEQQLAVAHD